MSNLRRIYHALLIGYSVTEVFDLVHGRVIRFRHTIPDQCDEYCELACDFGLIITFPMIGRTEDPSFFIWNQERNSLLEVAIPPPGGPQDISGVQNERYMGVQHMVPRLMNGRVVFIFGLHSPEAELISVAMLSVKCSDLLEYMVTGQRRLVRLPKESNFERFDPETGASELRSSGRWDPVSLAGADVNKIYLVTNEDETMKLDIQKRTYGVYHQPALWSSSRSLIHKSVTYAIYYDEEEE